MRIAESLVHRGFLQRVTYTETDGKNDHRYEKTPELREKCPQFTEYLMGIIEALR